MRVGFVVGGALAALSLFFIVDNVDIPYFRFKGGLVVTWSDVYD